MIIQNEDLSNLMNDINMLEGMVYLNSLLIEKINGIEITNAQYEAMLASDEVMRGLIGQISSYADVIV